jgi:O-antigen/teichoic acid export membrane protein
MFVRSIFTLVETIDYVLWLENRVNKQTVNKLISRISFFLLPSLAGSAATIFGSAAATIFGSVWTSGIFGVASTISGTSFPSGWHEDFRQPTFSTKK